MTRGRLGLIGFAGGTTRRSGVYSQQDHLAKRNATAADMNSYQYDERITAPISGTQGLTFGNNGARMYVCSTVSGSETVTQYNLSTAYDPSSYSDPGKSIDVEDYFNGGSVLSAAFNNAGTKLYVGGRNATASQDEKLVEFDLSTAWELDSATAQVKSLDVSGEENSPEGIHFKPDGTRLYVIGTSGDDINQYNLSTAWDISTATFSTSQSVSAQATTPNSLHFKSDGTKVFVLNNGNDTIYEYDLTTAWDLSTLTYNSVSLSVGSREAQPRGIFVGNSGSDLYVTGHAGDNIVRYTMSTAWDLSTASFTSESSSVGDGTPYGLFFKDDGTVVYSVNQNANTIRTYDLTGSAWDTGGTNLSFDNAVGPFFSTGGNSSISIGDSGTRLYLLDSTRKVVYQMPLGTAWDLSSVEGMLTINGAATGNETECESVQIKNGDTEVYLAGSGNVYQYTLGTAGRLHTASSAGSIVLINNVQGMHVSDDGSKLYAAGASTERIHRFSMSTAYDITTAIEDSSFILFSWILNNTLSPDATALWVSPDAIDIIAVDNTNSDYYRWTVPF